MAWATPETSSPLAGTIALNFTTTGVLDIQIWTEIDGEFVFVTRAPVAAGSTTASIPVDTRSLPNGPRRLWGVAGDESEEHADAGELNLVVDNAPARAAAASWWRPLPSESWNVQLNGVLDTRIVLDNYGIDLFDTPASSIATIKARGGHVMCYFSAGIAEVWRPDYAQFHADDRGRALDTSNTEYWLDTRSTRVRTLMSARMDLAVTKGCDAVLPGNLDSYRYDSGKPLSAETQLDFNRWLSAEARSRGLGIGLVNAVGQIAELAPFFDFAVNGRCHELGECAGYSSTFIARGKPVYNFESSRTYIANANGERDAMCRDAVAQGMKTQLVAPSLDGTIHHTCR